MTLTPYEFPDSLIYLLHTDNMYEEMLLMPTFFDMHKYEGLFAVYRRDNNKDVRTKLIFVPSIILYC